MEEDFSKYNGEGTILRKAQLKMLEILVEVDKVCKKHGIEYWLDFGTLLGAVRHQGFIPWDDDLDISVRRKDYKRLCEILKKELPDWLFVQTHATDKYYKAKFAKVRDKYSVFSEPGWNGKSMQRGIFIDIFPVEPGHVSSKKMLDFLYTRTFNRLRHYDGNKWEIPVAYLMSPFVYGALYFLRTINPLFSGKMIYSYGIKLPFPRQFQLNSDHIFPLKSLTFEGHEFMVPADPDQYLTNLYGNYMQVPAEENRRQHALEITFLDNKFQQ